MGEAKRRRLQDPNYGKPGYSYQERKVQVDFPRVMLNMPSPLPIAASEYEDCARAIVAEQREALLTCAIEAREEYQETMCLIVLRPPAPRQSMAMTFCSTTNASILWRRALARIRKRDLMNTDELFATALSELEPNQFLWAHLDIARKGIWARLVPVDDSNIAQVCGCDSVS